MIFNINETKVVTTQIELKPCPFCGSEKLDIVHISGQWGYSSSEDFVKCLKCGARSGKIKDSDCGTNRKLAVMKWNERVGTE